MGYRQESEKLLQQFLADLEKGETKDFKLLVNKWNMVADALADKISELSKLPHLSADQLFKDEKYREFLQQAKGLITAYAEKADGIISAGQARNLQLGVDYVNVLFGTRIPVEAVNNMIGMTREGTPLFELLTKSYPESVLKLSDALIEGTAMGKNPTAIAREMAEAMDGNLQRAMTICRTEEINAFRDSSLDAMKESGLVEEWEWLAESDACQDCLDNDGKTFPIDEPFDSHPNCRCAELPVIKE